MLKSQRFGVEIEMTGLSRSTAAQIVARKLNSRASAPECSCYHTIRVEDSMNRTWKIMRDASIRTVNGGDSYSVELVTPPLNYDDIETLQDIIRALREAGAKVNDSCGIHIHVDGVNHDAKSIKRLVKFFSARQDIIFDALDVGDRKNRWCKPISKELANGIRKCNSNNDVMQTWYSRANDGYSNGVNMGHYNTTRYHGLNLHAFFTKGTIEFRLFNSTLHAGKIKAYIQFCLAMSAWAIESDDAAAFRSVATYTAEQKYHLFKGILTGRLGLVGAEFKTCRIHMLAALKAEAEMQIAA